MVAAACIERLYMQLNLRPCSDLTPELIHRDILEVSN